MIKLGDRFSLFCNSSPMLYALGVKKTKHRILKWRYDKDVFYMSMYNRKASDRTTYYVELI